MPSAPRVFISYSHDSDAHKARVLEFAQSLRRDGIDVSLDQFQAHHIVDWPAWVREQMRPDQSDFVICVCTAEYRRRTKGNLLPGQGKGVYWEGALVDSVLHHSNSSRYIPVLFGDEPETSIVDFLRGLTYCRIVNLTLQDSGYGQLLRILHYQPGAKISLDVGASPAPAQAESELPDSAGGGSNSVLLNTELPLGTGNGFSSSHFLVQLNCDDDVYGVLHNAVHRADTSQQDSGNLTLRHVLFALLEAGSKSGRLEMAKKLRVCLGSAIKEETVASRKRKPWSTAAFSPDERLPSVSEVEPVLRCASNWVGTDPVDLPALALALVSEHSKEAASAFEALKPLTQTDIRERWLNALRDEAIHTGIDPARYDRWLYGEHIAAPAGVLPDLGRPRDASDDCLEVRRYALALAATAVACDTQPPLAIGVFGDWGAGKSHFMGLMEHEMRALATGPDERFHRYVLPVWFNAWHYADANLWASLMQALLEAVAGHFTPSEGKSEDAGFAKLLRQLDEVSSGAALAKTELAAAERAADEAQKQFESALDQAKNKEHLAKVHLADRFKELFEKQGGANIGECLAKELKALDLDGQANLVINAGSQYDAILAAAKQIETLVADTRSFWLALRKWQWVDIGLLLLIAVGSAALIWALQADFTTKVVGVATTVTSMVAAGLGWLRKRFNALARLRERLSEIRQKQAEAAAKAATSPEAKSAETAQRKLEAARQRLDAALAARQQAEAAVSESFVSARIARFVEQRLQSGLYREQLSLVSTVRRDLDTIARFLQQQSFDRVQQEAEARKHLAAASQTTSPMLDRIVLFIDDLDRCPPERVVEVLEAVHLLLAMPLFVVVVGVDVRWVSAALCKRYDGLLVGEHSDSERARPTATPTDYLEKIFQLPFRLSAIETATGNRLLRSLTGTQADRAAAGDGKAATPVAIGDSPLDAIATGSANPELPAERKTDQPDKAIEEERREVVAHLGISSGETDFMEKLLASLGGSPRRVRRFVNSYRVYKASLRTNERKDQLEGNRYRTVLVALALQIGLGHRLDEIRKCAPPSAPAENETATDKRDWLDAAKLDPTHRARLDNALDALKADGDTPVADEYQRLRDLLNRSDIARFSFAPTQR